MTTNIDSEGRQRIRVFREPVMLIVIALVMLTNVFPRNSMFGVRTRETLASDAAWVEGNRIGAIALLLACAVWIVAAIYLPRRYVKPVGVAAVLLSVFAMFASQGWTF
jgi:uncharacterized membrane protein